MTSTQSSRRNADTDRRRLPTRDRVLPRSVLGLSVLLLFASLGAAFSGAVLYAYYEYRLDRTQDDVSQFMAGFEDEIDQATAVIEDEREQAKSAIRKELEPLQRTLASGDTIEAVLESVTPSVYFVVTLDTEGQPSVGTAFVAFSDNEQSFLLTSFQTVRAATAQPAPAVRLRKGTEEFNASLHTWDEDRDLALLIVNRPKLPRLEWASGAGPRVGDRVFAVSGLGTRGGAISQGFVVDVSSSGLQHDAAIGNHFQGGPLLNAANEVVAIASRTYAPLGFSSDGVYFAPPVKSSCEKVLRCPSGSAAGAGDAR